MAPVANDRVWEDVKAASQAKQNIHAKTENDFAMDFGYGVQRN